MKKLLVVLFAVVVAAAVAMPAFADAISEGEHEATEIMSSVDCRGLSVEQQKEALRQAFLKAGWKDTSNDMRASAFANVDPEVKALAFMDLSTADEAQKEKILAARDEVIIHSQWELGNPEFLSYVENPVKREFGFAPDFYDLFPADWEIPAGLVGADAAEAPRAAVELAVDFAETFACRALAGKTA